MLWWKSDQEPDGDIPDEWVFERLRRRRNELLLLSDWTQVADAPVNKAAWAEYRQLLRDLPESKDNPREVEWPIEPE